jgi:hypothetical protein
MDVVTASKLLVVEGNFQCFSSHAALYRHFVADVAVGTVVVTVVLVLIDL